MLMLLFVSKLATQAVLSYRPDRRKGKSSSCANRDAFQSLQPVGGSSNQGRARSADRDGAMRNRLSFINSEQDLSLQVGIARAIASRSLISMEKDSWDWQITKQSARYTIRRGPSREPAGIADARQASG